MQVFPPVPFTVKCINPNNRLVLGETYIVNSVEDYELEDWNNPLNYRFYLDGFPGLAFFTYRFEIVKSDCNNTHDEAHDASTSNSVPEETLIMELPFDFNKYYGIRSNS